MDPIATKPPIHEVLDTNIDGPKDAFPRFQWLDRAGGSWIPDAAIGSVWSGVVVHWRENTTTENPGLQFAINTAAQDAYFHAFQRDWVEDAPGIQGSDGLQYHYYICNGHILQTRPESKHLWHASRANAWGLAICIAAGPGNRVLEENITALYSMLDWLCFGRHDLPLITPVPKSVPVFLASGARRQVTTHGVLWHDEARALEGLQPKGCCGPYKAIVGKWRDAHR